MRKFFVFSCVDKATQGTNEQIIFFFSYRFFADILLTPLEATRIRLVSERGFATGLVSGFMRIAREGGLRELYAGFLPILCKYVSIPL